MFYNSRMEVIYIDRLFIINLVTDYLILLVTARICGIYLRRLRYLLAALFGALYAVLSVLDGFGFLNLLPIRLCSGILTALIAYANEEKSARTVLVFFGVSALFGGAVWAISLQSGGTPGSTVYLPVSMPVLVLSFGITYAVLSVIFRRSVKNAQRTVHDAVISHEGHELMLRALCDSGNTLYDPVTGSSVMIVSSEQLRGIFGDKAILLGFDASGSVTDPTFAGRLRLIPYRAVGVGSGLLPAFRPDRITVDGKSRDDIIIAVSPTPVSGDGFDCIM